MLGSFFGGALAMGPGERAPRTPTTPNATGRPDGSGGSADSGVFPGASAGMRRHYSPAVAVAPATRGVATGRGSAAMGVAAGGDGPGRAPLRARRRPLGADGTVDVGSDGDDAADSGADTGGAWTPLASEGAPPGFPPFGGSGNGGLAAAAFQRPRPRSAGGGALVPWAGNAGGGGSGGGGGWPPSAPSSAAGRRVATTGASSAVSGVSPGADRWPALAALAPSARGGGSVAGASSTSGGARRGGSPARRPAVVVAVIGAPQAGKSSFVNAFLAANAPFGGTPAAPVGRCGPHGTVSVDSYADRGGGHRPRWALLDTPGREWGAVAAPAVVASPSAEQGTPPAAAETTPMTPAAADSDLLEALLRRGVPPGTVLVGPGAPALTAARLRALPPRPSAAAAHCVVVVSAAALLEDRGVPWALLRRRYAPRAGADAAVAALGATAAAVRAAMGGGRVPFFVVTHADRAGWRTAELKALLAACVPANRAFFVACPVDGGGGGGGAGAAVAMDAPTREALVALHAALMSECAVAAAAEATAAAAVAAAAEDGAPLPLALLER